MKMALFLAALMFCFCFMAIAQDAANVETGEDVTLATDTGDKVSEGDQIDVFHPETGKYDTEEVTAVDTVSGTIETDDMTEGVEVGYDIEENDPDEQLEEQYGDGEEL